MNEGRQTGGVMKQKRAIITIKKGIRKLSTVN